jgi:hypothetical protein
MPYSIMNIYLIDTKLLSKFDKNLLQQATDLKVFWLNTWKMALNQE